jgi:hypothetical protein
LQIGYSSTTQQCKKATPQMLEFIISYPMYIPFIILNTLIIYKVIKDVMNEDNGQSDDDDGGIFSTKNPILDLPPGVTLPTSTKEPVLLD